MPNIMAGFATRPHAAKHANGAADEIGVAGLSGELADAQKTAWAKIPDVPASLATACKFVSRGDAAAYDLSNATMTMDNGFHDWDVSAIVPAAAVAVLVKAYYSQAAGAGNYLEIKKKAYSNPISSFQVWTEVAGIVNAAASPVDIGADRLLQYKCTTTSANAGVVILGWWIPI